LQRSHRPTASAHFGEANVFVSRDSGVAEPGYCIQCSFRRKDSDTSIKRSTNGPKDPWQSAASTLLAGSPARFRAAPTGSGPRSGVNYRSGFFDLIAYAEARLLH